MPDLARLSLSLVWFGRRPVLLQKPPCPTRSPTTDPCDPPSGIIFPHCCRRTMHSETWSLCEQMPYLERVGPRWSRLGWGRAAGLGLAVLDGRWWMGLTWWSPWGLAGCAVGVFPPVCPRQRVAGGSSQGHINQTLHLPLFHCLPRSVSLLVSLHILHQARRAEQWVFEQSQSKASLSDSGHFTAKPWTVFTFMY